MESCLLQYLKDFTLTILFLGEPWSSLVEGDEQLDWPNKQLWNTAMHMLHNFLGLRFISY